MEARAIESRPPAGFGQRETREGEAGHLRRGRFEEAARTGGRGDFGRRARLAAPQGPVWSLHLVHRETGEVLRLNGLPLVIYTRDAAEGLASLLRNRDPQLWRAEMTPVGGHPRDPRP
ncbi:hypothetical protein [Rhodobacter sp. NSM]|uniref:hypothetical protein n=1 Tax=Rhodobacter sp. NSM TaxID=3457501 RepID=UPI003FD4E650